MTRAFEGKVEAGLRSAGWIVVLAAACAACGLFPGRKSAPAPVAVSTPVVTESVQVSAAPAYRLIVANSYDGPTSRLFVVNTLVKNIGTVPLHFRPETVRLRLPDGSGGTVFDRPRAQELLRRTQVGSLDAPLANDSLGSRLTYEILGLLLDSAALLPGQEAHGYLVADTRAPIASLDGVVLEVSATRASDQSVTHSSYKLLPRPATGGGGGN